MRLLTPDETEVIGRWTDSWLFGRNADRACRRVEWLLAEVLEKVPTDVVPWAALYRDPTDGRLWECVYLEGYLHGCGPQSLFWISEEDARKKYRFL